METIGKGFFLRGRLSTAFGSVDYRSDSESIDNVKQDISQLELHFGRDFILANCASLTPFAGIGSRVLNDFSDGKSTSSGLLGYDSEIAFAYVPLSAAAMVGFAF